MYTIKKKKNKIKNSKVTTNFSFLYHRVTFIYVNSLFDYNIAHNKT